MTRRTVLLGGLAGLGAVLTGCGAAPSTTTPTIAPPPAGPDTAAVEAQLAQIEGRFGGRLGVFGLDTGSGASVGHRADERFLMCSTSKVYAVSAVLRLRNARPGLLDSVVRYDSRRLVDYSPVTSQHVGTGMTVSAICDAAITRSDNTAENLLLDTVGGPSAVTAFVRTLGDQVSRFDRTEPDLNDTSPGDERDTSTPRQMAVDLRRLALDDGLDPAGRDLLTGWLNANTTGATRIRAGLPTGWTVGDKTGSGAQGEINDIAVARPPGRAPLIIAVYTSPTDPGSTLNAAAVPAAAAVVATALAH